MGTVQIDEMEINTPKHLLNYHLNVRLMNGASIYHGYLNCK